MVGPPLALHTLSLEFTGPGDFVNLVRGSRVVLEVLHICPPAEWWYARLSVRMRVPGRAEWKSGSRDLLDSLE